MSRAPARSRFLSSCSWGGLTALAAAGALGWATLTSGVLTPVVQAQPRHAGADAATVTGSNASGLPSPAPEASSVEPRDLQAPSLEASTLPANGGAAKDFVAKDFDGFGRPLFVVEPDGLDMPAFGDLASGAPAIAGAEIPPPPLAEMAQAAEAMRLADERARQAAAEALRQADQMRAATLEAARAVDDARRAADHARTSLEAARPGAGPAVAALPPQAPASPVETASAPPVEPTAVRAALDALIAEAAKGGRATLALRKSREEIAAVYAGRADAPLWIVDGRWTPAARSALERLALAGEDGLDLGAHRLTSLGEPSAGADLGLSEAVVAYGRAASGGRVEPWRISALITAKPETASPAEILSRVSAGADAGEALRGFNPPHPGYQALRAKLAELRREQPQTPAAERIPVGPTLKIGMRDPRVPLIRARLGLGPNESLSADLGETLVYDTRVAEAVKDFQRANGLPPSGQLTPRTIAALSGGEPSRLENEILANMERWRWLPRDLGRERIEVNIPDFALSLKQGEDVLHTARVVVGKPESPTPIFSDRMRFLVVNPSWTMPPSILKKEALPNLAADPDYYAKRGYEVIRRGDRVTVRQPPGERNALGHIKFMFPNDHSVYLHDTPSRGLFGRDARAFSHGCVRVDQPFRLAEAVLGGDWTERRLRGMVGRGERTINLNQPLPIHLTYFTAYVGEDGRLRLRDDLYGFSRRLRVAMGLER